MLWLGLLTLSIAIFILECLLLIFGLQLSYDVGLGVAVLNSVMGFATALLAQIKQRPPETWLLYGTLAWPISIVHIVSLPVKKEAANPNGRPVRSPAPVPTPLPAFAGQITGASPADHIVVNQGVSTAGPPLVAEPPLVLSTSTTSAERAA